ncbi:hypothetical protein GCM10009795_005300 [Nocardioides hankookensis]|uniref:Uncharacterized protein n=1 Tax=Nocardioides hankookensis TaxID=443157 RepID=A0ABW1LNT9_9ACTN
MKKSIDKRQGIFSLLLVGASDQAASTDMAADLLMLGSLRSGSPYWPCVLWEAGTGRQDFVHVNGPCRC